MFVAFPPGQHLGADENRSPASHTSRSNTNSFEADRTTRGSSLYGEEVRLLSRSNNSSPTGDSEKSQSRFSTKVVLSSPKSKRTPVFVTPKNSIKSRSASPARSERRPRPQFFEGHDDEPLEDEAMVLPNVPQSPLKRFFGEGSFLGKSTSTRDRSRTHSRSSSIRTLGDELKNRIKDLVSNPSHFPSVAPGGRTCD